MTILYSDFTLPSDIRDPLIRSFANRSKTNPFFALKSYAEQTEDMELVAKLSIVEKYGSRIPELVKRLESCFEHDFNQAGMQNILNRLHGKALNYSPLFCTEMTDKIKMLVKVLLCECAGS